jgi:hypothetical protein
MRSCSSRRFGQLGAGLLAGLVEVVFDARGQRVLRSGAGVRAQKRLVQKADDETPVRGGEKAPGGIAIAQALQGRSVHGARYRLAENGMRRVVPQIRRDTNAALVDREHLQRSTRICYRIGVFSGSYSRSKRLDES